MLSVTNSDVIFRDSKRKPPEKILRRGPDFKQDYADDNNNYYYHHHHHHHHRHHPHHH